jgi:hypothetical protein
LTTCRARILEHRLGLTLHSHKKALLICYFKLCSCSAALHIWSLVRFVFSMPRFSCPARPPWWKQLHLLPTPPRNQGPLASLRRRDCCDWRRESRDGAVTAVTRGRDPALNVTGTVLAVTAVAGGLEPLLLDRRTSLDHESLVCATKDTIALLGTSHHTRSTCQTLPRCRLRRCSRCLARPCGRDFVQKCTKAQTARCRAVVPCSRRRQDRALVAARRLGNKLDLSPPQRFSAPSPTWRAAGQLAFSWLQGQPNTCRRPPSDTWLGGHVPAAARCPIDPSLAR